MAHLEVIREQILELISEIKSRPDNQETVITEIKKRIQGFKHAQVILSEMLTYTTSEGQPSIDTADVTIRLNECIQFIKEAELILSQVVMNSP
jgi:hypothetical protein